MPTFVPQVPPSHLQKPQFRWVQVVCCAKKRVAGAVVSTLGTTVPCTKAVPTPTPLIKATLINLEGQIAVACVQRAQRPWPSRLQLARLQRTRVASAAEHAVGTRPEHAQGHFTPLKSRFATFSVGAPAHAQQSSPCAAHAVPLVATGLYTGN